jgi:hypothetical protein
MDALSIPEGHRQSDPGGESPLINRARVRHILERGTRGIEDRDLVP